MTATMTPADEKATRWDVVCDQHDYFRHGITQQHALNAVNRHNADYHAQPILTLGRLADLVVHAADQAEANPDDPDAEARHDTMMAAWCTLTGLAGVRALRYAREMDAGTVVHHAPF